MGWKQMRHPHVANKGQQNVLVGAEPALLVSRPGVSCFRTSSLRFSVESHHQSRLVFRFKTCRRKMETCNSKGSRVRF